MKPSIPAVFGWANGRFVAHWPGLFAIGLIAVLVPVTTIALERGDRNALGLWAQLAIGGIEQAIALLCTAAMILLVTEPEPARPAAALGAAVRAAPRLIAAGIVAGIAQWVPLFALTYVLGGSGFAKIIAAIAAVPLAFVCRLGYASAVIERMKPLVAISEGFYRASAAGIGITVAFGLLIAAIEQLPPLALLWAANRIFPPELLTFGPLFPSGTVPQASLPPGMAGMVLPHPGRFGSGIPWGAFVAMRVVMVPLMAYVATIFAGAAIAFAAADPITVRRPAKGG